MPGPFDPTAVRQIGRYVVRRYLAEGGMSWVFEVTDPQFFDARRALKLLKPEAAVGDEERRFEAEVGALARLEHDNLVKVYDRDRDPATGYMFYTMEFLDGPDLSEVVADWLLDPDATRQPGRTHTLEDICHYFDGVLLALARLHGEGIFHRDIKPENIYLSADGTAKLGDLGIAKGVGSAGLTQAGRVPGTPRYMSPEQSMGEEVRAPSDLFSLGLTLYRVLTGQTAYDGVDGLDSTNSNMVLRHLWRLQGDRVEFELEFPPAVPQPIREVVRTACRVDPAARYADAPSMRAALRAALMASLAAPPPRPAFPWGRVAAGLAVVAALAVAGWFGARVFVDDGRRAALAAEQGAVAVRADLDHLMKSLGDVPAAREALLQAKRGLERAGFQHQEARNDLTAAQYPGAQRRFESAAQGYAYVCKGLIEQYLEAAATSQVEVARAESQRLPEAARRWLAEDVAALDDRLAALETPLEGQDCARARTLDERIVEAAGVGVAVASIRKRLSDRLPEVAAEELERAEAAAGEVRALAAGDDTYRDALREGDRKLADARGLERRKEYQAAIDTVRLAVESFSRARDAADCVALRRTAEALVGEADQSGLTIGTLRIQYLSAGQAREAGELGRCAEEYRGVVGGLQDLLAAAAPALEACKAARAERDNARAAGVEEDLLAECVTQLGSAESRMGAQRYASAAEACQAAQQSCGSAVVAMRERQEREARDAQAREEAERLRALRAEEAEQGAKQARSQLGERLELARSKGLPLASVEAGRGAAQELYEAKRWEEAREKFAALLQELENLDREASPVLASRTAAEAARKRAVQGGASAEALRAGDDALGGAVRSFEAGRFAAAREGFDGAAAAFQGAVAAAERDREEAEQLASAEAARKRRADEAAGQAAKLARTVGDKGLALTPKLQSYYDAAEADRKAARYEDAAEGFRVVEEELRGLLERATPALADRDRSRSARRKLAAQGAGAGLLKEADGLQARGDAALRDGELEDASSRYGEALRGYAAAEKSWKQELAEMSRRKADAERARGEVAKRLHGLQGDGVGLGPLQAEHTAAQKAFEAGRYPDAQRAFEALVPRLEAHRREAGEVLTERDRTRAAIEQAAASPAHKPAKLAESRDLIAKVQQELAAGRFAAARERLGAAAAAARAALPSPEDYAVQTLRDWNAGWDQEDIGLVRRTQTLSDRNVQSIERVFEEASVSQQIEILGVQQKGAEQFEVKLSYDRVIVYPDRKISSQKSGRALVARANGRWQISDFDWD